MLANAPSIINTTLLEETSIKYILYYIYIIIWIRKHIKYDIKKEHSLKWHGIQLEVLGSSPALAAGIFLRLLSNIIQI